MIQFYLRAMIFSFVCYLCAVMFLFVQELSRPTRMLPMSNLATAGQNAPNVNSYNRRRSEVMFTSQQEPKGYINCIRQLSSVLMMTLNDEENMRK